MENLTDNLPLFPGRHYFLEMDDAVPSSRVISDINFATPWSRFDLVRLDAAEQWAPAAKPAVEEGIILLGGVVEVEWAGTTNSVAAPATVLFPVGKSSGLRNAGTDVVRLLDVQVGLTQPAYESHGLQIEAIDPERLQWRDAIHGGVGRIATRHIWGPADFSSSWTFMDHAVLGPQGSVGYHYHDALEECFVILAGRGYMSIDAQTFAVGPGSVTWQGIGQAHGIYNPHDTALDFLRIAVAQPDAAYTTIDLHDDLTGRRPDGQKD